jgi:hypothetical protein
MSNDTAFSLDDFTSPRSAHYNRSVRPPASSCIAGRELQKRSCSAISLVVHIEHKNSDAFVRANITINMKKVFTDFEVR